MTAAAANPQIHSQPQPRPHLAPVVKPALVIPTKLAIFGDQGAGKTTTAALYAAWLSKEHHQGAPVWVTDPELGWQFPKRTIFRREGIELVQRTVPTFKAMLQDMRDAERAGACVWAVELGKIWLEILKTCRKEAGNNWGQQLVNLWNEYVNYFLNSKMHCIALGRVGDITEEVIGDDNKIQRIKTGEKMKAGGSSNFGYEPHLVLRMSLEAKPRRKDGKVMEGEGRMLHCAHVLKDRTWELNGMMFKWSDKTTYKAGGYSTVGQSLKPHFTAVQETMGIVQLDTTASSSELIDDEGRSEWYARQQRKEVLSAELHATMDSLWGGTAVAAKQMRMKVFEHVFGFKSKEAADAQPLEKIERGVRVLQAFEKRVKRELEAENDVLAKGENEILAQLDIDIREFDEGLAEEQELPF